MFDIKFRREDVVTEVFDQYVTQRLLDIREWANDLEIEEACTLLLGYMGANDGRKGES
jgi:hypothetical protein